MDPGLLGEGWCRKRRLHRSLSFF